MEYSRGFEKDSARLIGLSGTLGAGKDVYAGHLVDEHGFLHVSTGDLLRDIARQKGLDTERPTLVELGVRLRSEYKSQGALVIKAIEKWHNEAENYPGGLAVSGLRAVGEAQEVIDHSGIICFIDAPREVRYERIVQRQRDNEAMLTLDTFAARDESEINGDPHDESHPNLGAIKKMSHHIVMNLFANETLLFQDIDRRLGYRD